MGSYELKDTYESSEKVNPENPRNNENNSGVSTGSRTWRHGLITLVTFLYFAGVKIGLFISIQYFYQRVQHEIYPNMTFNAAVSYCGINRSDPQVVMLSVAQKKAAQYNVMFALVGGIPSIFVNILAGSLTDRFGRIFLLLASMFGTFCRIAVILIGMYIGMDMPLFAIGFAIEGSTGQLFAYILASYAYIADVTSRSERALGIVLNEFAIGLGMSLPSLGVGYFMQAYGFKYPLMLALGCIATALFITIVLLPESYPSNKRSKSSKRLENLRHSVEFYYASWNTGSRWKYIVCILAFFCTMSSVVGRISVETLYQLNAPFCWDPEKLGLFDTLRTLLQHGCALAIVLVLKRFWNDMTLAIISAAFLGASFVIEGLANSDAIIYIVTAVGAPGMLTAPMVRSIMSEMTSPDKQGALTAGIAMVDTVCTLSSTVVLNAIYNATVKTNGGSVFFVMASLNVTSLLLMVLLKYGSRKDVKNKALREISVQPMTYSEKVE